MFKGKIDDEMTLCNNFLNWFREHKNEFAKRDVNPHHIPILRGRPIIVNADTGEEDLFVGTHKKGDIIRYYLKEMHKEVYGNIEKVHDFVICIDGDNDISFNNIFKVLDSLISGEKVCLSCRQGKFGMGEPRDQIERFELNIVESIFNKSIPDGQCGCWGMHHSIVKDLELSANGFEIELDIIINILKKGIVPFYIDLSVKQQGSSTFDAKDHEDKLKFICDQLKISPELLNKIYEYFIIEYRYTLPKEYLCLKQFKGKKPDGREIKIETRKSTFKCEKTYNKICNRCDREGNNFKVSKSPECIQK
ncbi:MAG: hypothetical protein NTU57_02325 [Candidatus Aenigmarchaeota archaeon]|nr:hypothetical protein [Candidatus Aenigmarchaeota archaeon]